MARETSWQQIVIQADPEWPRNSRVVPEYEFSGPGPKPEHVGGMRQSAYGMTIFLRDYHNNGIYAETIDDSVIETEDETGLETEDEEFISVE